MVVGAVVVDVELTLQFLVEVGMVEVFFVTVGVLTSNTVNTTLLPMRITLLLTIPILTLIRLIAELIRSAPKILHIMRVDALAPILMVLLLLGKRAPDRLKMEHVEVGVEGHLVQEVYEDVVV